jgi:hypothetical protein
MSNRKTTNIKTLRKRKGGKARIYYSSTEVRAVSNDGGKKWHIDADINGKKRHANLTKHDIMDVLSYPASPKDLRTRLLEDFDMHRGDHMDETREMQKVRNERNERKMRNTRKIGNIK